MLGMIRKEICLILNNKRFLLVALLIYVFYSAIFDMDMSFFLPFMASMLSISSFSYDDYNNWQTYASSLPQGRLSIVRAKYVVSLGSSLLAAVAGIIMSYGVSAVKGTAIPFEERASTMMGVLMGIILMMSILFPILFKYGAEKGRMAMLMIGLGIGAVIMILARFVRIDISVSTLDFLKTYLPYIFIFICAAGLLISYFVSKKIYLNKEF